MKITHTQDVTIQCSHKEFQTLCAMVEGNVPDGDLETAILTELEEASELTDALKSLTRINQNDLPTTD